MYNFCRIFFLISFKGAEDLLARFIYLPDCRSNCCLHMVLCTSFLLKKWLECSTDNESNWLSSAPHRYAFVFSPSVLFLLYTPYWIHWYTFAQWQKWLLWSSPLIERNKYKNDLLWKKYLYHKSVWIKTIEKIFYTLTQTVRLISKEKDNTYFFFFK